MIAHERLYVSADRKTVVREGDERAAFLLAAKGQEIPPPVVRQYGLEEGGIKEKRGRKPANKMVEHPEDKAGGFAVEPAEEE